MKPLLFGAIWFISVSAWSGQAEYDELLSIYHQFQDLKSDLEATDPKPGPQGEKGDTGPKGEVGPRGPAGTAMTSEQIATTFGRLAEIEAYLNHANGNNQAHTERMAEIHRVLMSLERYVEILEGTVHSGSDYDPQWEPGL